MTNFTLHLLYNLALYLFFPVLLVRLALRGLKNSDYWKRWGERFGYFKGIHGPFGVWVHAVSVGEVNAAAPMINALLEKMPEQKILITTMTPTGSNQVIKAFGERVQHVYVPYDYPGAVRRFLQRIKPALAVIMETEIWPNLINQCHAADIPIVYANVRLSERSYQGYEKFRGVVSPAIKNVNNFFVQTEADAKRIQNLGAPVERIHVTGSIKFEVDLPASLREVAQVIRSQWGRDRSVWVAGSTHEGEDEQLLGVYDDIKKQIPDLLLVLVPRHPERFDGVYRLTERSGYRTVRRSEHPGDLPSQTEVYIGDTMGELAMLYAAADVAFVGGSLVAVGGHNVLEPCGVGVPVLFGPHMFNFVEISKITVERGAGLQVNNKQELISVLLDLLKDSDARFQMGQAGAQMIEENKGALNRCLELLKPFLKLEP